MGLLRQLKQAASGVHFFMVSARPSWDRGKNNFNLELPFAPRECVSFAKRKTTLFNVDTTGPRGLFPQNTRYKRRKHPLHSLLPGHDV